MADRIDAETLNRLEAAHNIIRARYTPGSRMALRILQDARRGDTSPAIIARRLQRLAVDAGQQDALTPDDCTQIFALIADLMGVDSAPPRDHSVRIRLTADELAALSANAADAEVSYSDYVRQRCCQRTARTAEE